MCQDSDILKESMEVVQNDVDDHFEILEVFRKMNNVKNMNLRVVQEWIISCCFSCSFSCIVI